MENKIDTNVDHQGSWRKWMGVYIGSLASLATIIILNKIFMKTGDFLQLNNYEDFKDYINCPNSYSYLEGCHDVIIIIALFEMITSMNQMCYYLLNWQSLLRSTCAYVVCRYFCLIFWKTPVVSFIDIKTKIWYNLEDNPIYKLKQTRPF